MFHSSGLLTVKTLESAHLLSFFERVKSDQFQVLSESKNKRIGALCFFEDSTRTRVSFEKAGLDLGIQWIHWGSGATSLNKGESLQDSFEVLKSYGIDFFVVRHAENGICKRIAEWVKRPVINAGDGNNEHPTQAMGDIFVMREAGRGTKIVFYGDVLRSRVAGSLAPLIRSMGWQLKVFCGSSSDSAEYAQHEGFEEAQAQDLKEADYIYVFRIQKERGSHSQLPPLSLQMISSPEQVMHAGPVIYGQDLSEEFLQPENRCPLIIRQVESLYRIRRRLLQELIESLENTG